MNPPRAESPTDSPRASTCHGPDGRRGDDPGTGRATDETTPLAEGDRRIVARLRSIEGHVRGVERMIREGAYCMDVVNQILAVQRALQKVNTAVLDRHLHACATSAIRGDDADERERVLEELLDVFAKASR